MKKAVTLIICTMLLLMLCACDKETDTTNTPTENVSTADEAINYSGDEIIGTWVCDDINKDCYFIFEENGDAFAKWGTSTVYGYFDYDDETNLYDIDVPNFLYNEYKAKFNGDKMTLTSDESAFEFEKATMPEITIKGPDNYAIDDKILGNWQSADSYECYRFNSGGTAVITDLYSYATIDCKFSCNDGVVTLYYMASETKDGNKQIDYSFTDDGKLKMGDYTYDKVEE